MWEAAPGFQSEARWKPELTVDRSTLSGKVVCGYQGWFAAEGDGSGIGWHHYRSRRGFNDENWSFDYWPDMSELSEEEKYPSPFKYRDGSTAYLFSSYNQKTVERHFWWMQQHDIAGVFLQRFAVEVANPRFLKHRNQVTRNVQAGAFRFGRGWAVMYDLSGAGKGEIENILKRDWKELVDRFSIKSDRTYFHHNGKPVVAIWGVGFHDREYTLKECANLIDFFQNDPVYGGNTVMLGVPTSWRTLSRDSISDPALHEVLKKADILSPWTVGRYNRPEQLESRRREFIEPDIGWCKEHDLDYMPVIWAGFSWHNLKRSHGQEAQLEQIPRLGGRFLWKQAIEAKKGGAEMLYVAMFDEIDEGTQIFKVTNNPPEPSNRFVTYKGLPSDHYLWLTGQISKLIRGETEPSEQMPARD